MTDLMILQNFAKQIAAKNERALKLKLLCFKQLQAIIQPSNLFAPLS